jgi:hypothetical protein
MISSSWIFWAVCLSEIALLHVCRSLAHRAFPNAVDKNTPGRVGSLVQGAFCALFLWQDDIEVALMTTALYFLYDLYAALYFKRPLPMEMKVHHATGAFLCIVASIYDGWKPEHSASAITLALLAMEVTNPVFHTAMILRSEFPRMWSFFPIKALLSAGIVLGWIYFRIVNVTFGLWKSLLAMLKTDQYVTSVGLVLGVGMLILQIQWFLAIVRKAQS